MLVWTRVRIIGQGTKLSFTARLADVLVGLDQV